MYFILPFGYQHNEYFHMRNVFQITFIRCIRPECITFTRTWITSIRHYFTRSSHLQKYCPKRSQRIHLYQGDSARATFPKHDQSRGLLHLYHNIQNQVRVSVFLQYVQHENNTWKEKLLFQRSIWSMLLSTKFSPSVYTI